MNSVGPDQLLESAASDLSQDCLLSPAVKRGLLCKERLCSPPLGADSFL